MKNDLTDLRQLLYVKVQMYISFIHEITSVFIHEPICLVIVYTIEIIIKTNQFFHAQTIILYKDLNRLLLFIHKYPGLQRKWELYNTIATLWFFHRISYFINFTFRQFKILTGKSFTPGGNLFEDLILILSTQTKSYSICINKLVCS